jgi:hypothetical protein
MKKSLKNANRGFTLGDLILAVSNTSRSTREVLAAMTDLLQSGRIRIQSGGHAVRARVL